MPAKTFSYLENILRFQNKNELQEAADFFRIPVRSSDRKAVMIEKLVNAYRTDMLRCLECLPLYELRNLKLLVSMGKGADMLIPEPVPPIFTYMFGLVEDCYDDEYTVKRVEIHEDGAVLLPCNEKNTKYKPIPVGPDNDFLIWGVVTWVIKKV